MAMRVKNISFKVVLLLLFVLMAIVAVLFFLRTRAENPPEQPQMTNEKYIDDINKQINELNEQDISSSPNTIGRHSNDGDLEYDR